MDKGGKDVPPGSSCRGNRAVTISYALIAIRTAAAPVLLLLAWSGRENTFLTVLVVAFVTDSIDGPIARYMHQESEIGSKMDTSADVSIYISYMISAFWLWPDIVRREQIYFMMLFASILVPAAAGAVKFRRITGYHTWLVKIASVCIAVSSLLMFVFGPAALFRISAVICLLAGLEELSITLVLKNPETDVRGLWDVLKKERYK